MEEQLKFGSDEMMKHPSIEMGADSGWSTLGPVYNKFDKKTLWGGMQFKTRDNAKAYYDYLMLSDSFRSGSGGIGYEEVIDVP